MLLLVDFIETLILSESRIVPTGRRDFCWTLTQDCAALVLGYYRFSLREKNTACFTPRGSAKPVDDRHLEGLISSCFRYLQSPFSSSGAAKYGTLVRVDGWGVLRRRKNFDIL
jgi:hypothetical protein